MSAEEEAEGTEPVEETPAPDAAADQEVAAADETPAADATGDADASADETPEEDAGPEAEAAAPAEPGAPTEAEAEADAVPEDVPESTEEEYSTDAGGGDEVEPTPDESSEAAPDASPAPEAKRKMPAKAEKRDVVPGADLEPIAISEERELTAEEKARAEAEEEERAAREARASIDDDDEEVAQRTVTVPADAKIQATGKRKSAVARVILRSGDGTFQINDRSIEQYFPSSLHQAMARQALVSSGYDGNVDVRVRVHGGGVSGQAGAVRHGVARALTVLEPELRGDLKRRGMLTRDDRRKERKKAGLKKARKRPQFSKR